MRSGPRPTALLPVLFFVSGATALAGQVVLNRLLVYVFGASHLATSTVLAAYMAGLALGSLSLARLAPRLRRPIVTYALLELGVASFFALVPAVYPLFQAASGRVARALGAGAFTFGLVRFALSFGFVLVPTVFMGGTLPALVASFGERDGLRRRLPQLYALNTLGGAVGVLLSGYLLVFTLGLDGTLYAGAATNALVGLLALAVALSVRGEGGAGPGSAGGEDEAHDPSPWSLSPALVCALAYAQGALSFSLEVVWSHLIRTVIGVTTYSFTVMLTVVLLGIGLGSYALILFGRRERFPLRQFVLAQLLLAGSLAASLFAWDRFPDFVWALLRRRFEWSFGGRELMRFVFAVPLLLPAGAALGLSLPALTAAVRGGRGGGGASGGWVGRVFGYNTLGAICGALFTGFVLLGRVPSDWLLRACALAALALAAAPYVLTGRPRRGPGRGEVAVALGIVAALGLFPGWDLQKLTSGKHFTWDFGMDSPPVFLREDAQSGFVTVHAAGDGTLVMKTNGKYEGSSAEAEFQDNFALMGALYVPRFGRAGVLGLGPGRTLALLHEMPFRSIEVMEFSPAIVAAARAEFGQVSGEALADEARVRLFVDDGRNHLQLSRDQYDYLVVGITAAAFAGTGGLYNRDFFALVRSRLAPDGVFLMWIQTHHIFPEDVRSVVFSLRDAFPHVHLYAVPEGQAFLVASASPLRIDRASAERLSRAPRASRILRKRGYASATELVVWNVFSRDEDLQRYFRSPIIPAPPVLYTDLRPRFEFTAPMGLATHLLRCDFGPFASAGLPDFTPPLSAEEAQSLAWSRRQALGGSGGQGGGGAAAHSAASSSSN